MDCWYYHASASTLLWCHRMQHHGSHGQWRFGWQCCPSQRHCAYNLFINRILTALCTYMAKHAIKYHIYEFQNTKIQITMLEQPKISQVSNWSHLGSCQVTWLPSHLECRQKMAKWLGSKIPRHLGFKILNRKWTLERWVNSLSPKAKLPGFQFSVDDVFKRFLVRKKKHFYFNYIFFSYMSNKQQLSIHSGNGLAMNQWTNPLT